MECDGTHNDSQRLFTVGNVTACDKCAVAFGKLVEEIRREGVYTPANVA